jgi:transposase
MNHFLALLARHYSNYRIVLLLDKAGWHISQGIKLPPNLLLMHLPPYSPELNPVELLWREIRRKHFHNKIFDGLDDVENTLTDALAQYHSAPSDIKQLSEGYAF